eukprot:GHUV01044957.1.p2 GENE.GHUV01044957.1~~GHUV01044957.1.p2  ORF type:complete len:102 (-),score=0.66 GHUV01044957.1:745-1050(-)
MQTRLLSKAPLRQLRGAPINVRCVPHVSKVYPRHNLRCKQESRSVTNEVPDPENSIVAQTPIEAQPLVSQFEAERNDEDRETFVTAEGLVEEVEEEDAKVF